MKVITAKVIKNDQITAIYFTCTFLIFSLHIFIPSFSTILGVFWLLAQPLYSVCFVRNVMSGSSSESPIKQESIGRWISLLYRQGQITIGHELSAFNIHRGQAFVLMMLFQEDGLNQEELARRLCVDKATSGRAIKKLEAEGYVDRLRDPNDKRAYRIQLTEKGRLVEPELTRIFRNWTSVLSQGFSEEEKEQALALLKQMYENALQVKYKNEADVGGFLRE